MNSTRLIRTDKSRTHRFFYSLAHFANRLLVHALAPRMRITGHGHVPQHGAVILVANHISHFDAALIGSAVRRPLWFMAMSEIFEIPVVSILARFCQAFPVKRGRADLGALKGAEQLLREGHALVIFPEGRLSQSGQLGPILPGASLLSLHAGVPIIPVGISGSEKIMPYGPTCPRPSLAPVHLHFGAPLDLSHLQELPRREARKAATLRLEAAIVHCVALARADQAQKAKPAPHSLKVENGSSREGSA
jgi:1-acyl-sn-glycerol-3-phosphate acyltransferase